MPVKCPQLLSLGGETAFGNYQAEFRRLYLGAEVRDVLGKLVEFPGDSCHHVCFKEASSVGPRALWVPERAARIPWIGPALSDPGTEVRQSIVRGRFCYILAVEDDSAQGLYREFFGVVAEETSTRRTVRFVTAFPLERETLREWRQTGPVYHPRRPQRKSKRRGTKQKGGGL